MRNSTLLELRSTGAQTLFPGSTHPSGEHVRWGNNGEPAKCKHSYLAQACTKLAFACLLTKAWPSPGARHDTALAVGGMLARANWDEEEIGEFIGTVAQEAGDDEVIVSGYWL